MGKTGAGALGLGVWLLDLGLQLYSSAYPDQIKPHPHLIVGLGVMGLLFVLYGVVSWFGQRKAPELASAVQTQTARDVSGKMFQAEKIEYHEAPAVPSTYQVHKVVEKKPALAIGENSGHEYLTYERGEAFWKIDSKGRRMLIIHIVNPIPDNDGESIKANRISVHLKFNFENHFSMDVERAYWVGESSNEIELLTGKKKSVIIGFHNEGEWCSFENIHSDAQPGTSWDGYKSWRDDPVEKSIPFPEGNLTFEVCVLYANRNSTVFPIARKLFIVKVVASPNVLYCEAVKS